MAGTVEVGKIMMATEAFHPGTQMDISSPTPDLAYIQFQQHGVFIGQWVFGLGFLEVRFPIKTTRPLTEPEADYWQRGGVKHSNGIRHRFRRKDFWVRNLSFPEHNDSRHIFVSRHGVFGQGQTPRGPGWYFWDETGADANGPYQTEWEAELGLSYYMMFLDNQLRGRLCPHRPEKRDDQAIGQYHCPICGMMCVAGIPHLNPSPLMPDQKMYKDPDDIFWKLWGYRSGLRKRQ